MNIFTVARAGVNLSPAQRALLRLIEGFAAAAFSTALVYVLQVAASQGAHINYGLLGQYAIGAFVVAFLLAVSKYLKAHGDAALGDTLAAAAVKAQDIAAIPKDVVLDPFMAAGAKVETLPLVAPNPLRDWPPIAPLADAPSA